MAKLLNVDSLSKTEDRELTIGGKTYKVLPLTVENFIETVKAAERIKEDSSLSTQLAETLSMITRTVPGIKGDTLQKLSLDQLKAVAAFVRGEDEGAEDTEAGK